MKALSQSLSRCNKEDDPFSRTTKACCGYGKSPLLLLPFRSLAPFQSRFMGLLIYLKCTNWLSHSHDLIWGAQCCRMFNLRHLKRGDIFGNLNYFKQLRLKKITILAISSTKIAKISQNWWFWL